MNAERLHEVLAGRTRELAANPELLQRPTRERLHYMEEQAANLRKDISLIDEELNTLTTRLDTRIEELSRTNSPSFRASLQRNVVRLDNAVETKRQKVLCMRSELGQVEALVRYPVSHYQNQIGRALKEAAQDTLAVADLITCVIILPRKVRIDFGASSDIESEPERGVKAPMSPRLGGRRNLFSIFDYVELPSGRSKTEPKPTIRRTFNRRSRSQGSSTTWL